MKLKRIIAMVLACLMLFSATGCGQEATPVATPSTQPSQEPSPSSSAPAKEEKPVVLSLYVDSNESDFDRAQQQRFMEKYPNIVIDKKVTAHSDGSNALVMFAAGTNPDIGSCSLPQFANYVYAGLPRSLEDYIANWSAEQKANMRTEMLENYKVNGEVYGMPFANYAMVLAYNKSTFAKAGLQPPTTWDEFYNTAAKLTDPAQGKWGFNLLSVWTEWWFEYFVWMAGGDLTKLNDDGTVELTFTDPAVKTALEYYRKLIAGKVVQPDMTMDYDTMQNQFIAGNAAMTLYGSDAFRHFVNKGMNPDDIGYAPLPIGPSGKPTGQLGGSAHFIYSNATQEKADAVWKWIEFFNSKEESELRLIDSASKGGANPQVAMRMDIDSSLGQIRQDLQDVVNEVTPHSRLEFAGKAIVGGFVDAAVRKTMLDPSVDIMEEFKRQQDLAQVEIDKYNESVLNQAKK